MSGCIVRTNLGNAWTRMHGILAVAIGFILCCALYVFLPVHPGKPRQAVLRMATTTSVDHSGLLRYLLPQFEKKYNIIVHVIAVGTGRALKLGEQGDVDLLLVHAPEAEQEFIRKGFGINRRVIMENDFLLVGPRDDPAGLKQAHDLNEALKRLARGKVAFISRGDDSGTHKKERSLWKMAGVKPVGDWYKEVGQGMGPALLIANGQQAYTLTDLGTYLSMKGKLDLAVCFKGDPALLNTYSVILVNPMNHSRINKEPAEKFQEWICSPAAQQLIGEYQVGGEALFRPRLQTPKEH